jgi:hypothetical protein
MKKLIIMAFLVMICLLGAEAVYPEISINEIAKRFLPGFELVRRPVFQGSGHRCDVAKDSGDIVIMTSFYDTYLLNYMDYRGYMVWQKLFSEDITAWDIDISDDGKYVHCVGRTMLNGMDELNIVQAYDNTGELLGETEFVVRDPYFSPDGLYTTKIPTYSGRDNELYYFDNKYEKITITTPYDGQFQDCRPCFGSDNNLYVYLSMKNRGYWDKMLYYGQVDNDPQILWEKDVLIYEYMIDIVNLTITGDFWVGYDSHKTDFTILEKTTGETLYTAPTISLNYVVSQKGNILRSLKDSLVYLEMNSRDDIREQTINVNPIKGVKLTGFVEIDDVFFLNVDEDSREHAFFVSKVCAGDTLYKAMENFYYFKGADAEYFYGIYLHALYRIDIQKQRPQAELYIYKKDNTE